MEKYIATYSYSLHKSEKLMSFVQHVTQDELSNSNSLVDFPSLSFINHIWFFCWCFSILVFCLSSTFLGTGTFSYLTSTQLKFAFVLGGDISINMLLFSLLSLVSFLLLLWLLLMMMVVFYFYKEEKVGVLMLIFLVIFSLEFFAVTTIWFSLGFVIPMFFRRAYLYWGASIVVVRLFV